MQFPSKSLHIVGEKYPRELRLPPRCHAPVPARKVVGLRLADPKDGEITSDFHCWAEFYLPGHGGVMVDPADVRKMMLVNRLELKDAETKKWREFFWNGDDLFRIVLNKDSREVELIPKQRGETLTYFMYPFGQVDGETLNFFDPKKFSYKVDFTLDRYDLPRMCSGLHIAQPSPTLTPLFIHNKSRWHEVCF